MTQFPDWNTPKKYCKQGDFRSKPNSLVPRPEAAILRNLENGGVGYGRYDGATEKRLKIMVESGRREE
jgi:hypothetical protein